MPHTHRTLVAAVLIVATGAAQAATFLARANAHVLPGGPDDAQSAAGRAPVSIVARSQGSAKDESGTINTSAVVAAGADRDGVHLHATTRSTVDSIARFAEGYAEAFGTASMGDSFVLSASTLPLGTTLQANVLIFIDATLSGLANAPVLAESWASWSSRTVIRHSGVTDADESLALDCYMSQGQAVYNCLGAQPGFHGVPVILEVGRTYSWSLQGDVHSTVLGAAGSVAVSDADLGHTIAWGGLRDLRDMQGRPVTGLHAWNPGGDFDYVNAFASVPAVPEPGSAVLMLAGLAVAGRRLSRHRSAPGVPGARGGARVGA